MKQAPTQRARVVGPFSSAREVERWEEYCGVPTVIRKMGVRRVVAPDVGFTPDDEKKILAIRKKLADINARPATTSTAAIESRRASISKLSEQLECLLEKRAPLTAWEDEQLRRCMEGYNTLTGFQYFYFNFGWIQEILEGGITNNIQPNYRQCDDWVARLLIKVQEDCTGLVMVKRRRFGWTWMLVAWIVYNILFKDGNIFFVTKDEDDQKKFYDRIAYFHDSLPAFLRKPKGRDALEYKSFLPSKRIAEFRGIPIERIPAAFIRCASPRNIANMAGGTCSMFIIDEAGETPNLRGVLKIGIPMLAASDGLTRAGCLIMGGTVGNMETSGAVLQRIFNRPAPFNIIPVSVPGWMGVYVDKNGNDD